MVATKAKVSKMNRIDTKKPAGRFCVIASKAAGKLKPSKACETEPACASSIDTPVPPTMVNQKLVTSGATIDSRMMIERIERPRLTRATNTAISGP